jgi:hypothetical protein
MGRRDVFLGAHVIEAWSAGHRDHRGFRCPLWSLCVTALAVTTKSAVAVTPIMARHYSHTAA